MCRRWADLMTAPQLLGSLHLVNPAVQPLCTFVLGRAFGHLRQLHVELPHVDQAHLASVLTSCGLGGLAELKVRTPHLSVGPWMLAMRHLQTMSLLAHDVQLSTPLASLTSLRKLELRSRPLEGFVDAQLPVTLTHLTFKCIHGTELPRQARAAGRQARAAGRWGWLTRPRAPRCRRR